MTQRKAAGPEPGRSRVASSLDHFNYVKLGVASPLGASGPPTCVTGADGAPDGDQPRSLAAWVSHGRGQGPGCRRKEAPRWGAAGGQGGDSGLIRQEGYRARTRGRERH